MTLLCKEARLLVLRLSDVFKPTRFLQHLLVASIERLFCMNLGVIHVEIEGILLRLPAKVGSKHFICVVLLLRLERRLQVILLVVPVLQVLLRLLLDLRVHRLIMDRCSRQVGPALFAFACQAPIVGLS